MDILKSFASSMGRHILKTLLEWRGREKILLIELVRSLDEAAFAFTMAPNRADLVKKDRNRHLMLIGAASALKPVLRAIRNDAGGVPWAPSSPSLQYSAEKYLMICGEFAIVRRLIEMARYGLAQIEVVRDDYVIVDVSRSDDDFAERSAAIFLESSIQKELSEIEYNFILEKKDTASIIDSYAFAQDGWFIGYNPTIEMMEYHRKMAVVYSHGTAEANSLPGSSVIGGRTFQEWNDLSVTALGRILHHVACATRLRAKNNKLVIRNMLTVFSRKEDVFDVWRESLQDSNGIGDIISALSLDHNVADLCERDHEIPLPYYIDFGKDFFLLPMFGGLLNANAGVNWHLRRNYRKDWDRSVDGREAVFREDLKRIFPHPRYTIPEKKFVLKRSNGSIITDIDAIIIDNGTGEIALIQLKWLDIYGRSLAERNSRKINFVKANEWVGKVSEWIGGKSSKEIAMSLKLDASSLMPPALIVLARHVAKFSEESSYDNRATWISWPQLVKIFLEREPKSLSSFISIYKSKIEKIQTSNNRIHRKQSVFHRLPGLTVEIKSQ